MKKIFKNLLILIIASLSLFNFLFLGGCSDNDSNFDFNIPETSAEAFAYQIVDEDVYIIGLTEYGKKLDNIHIPNKIEGKNVVGLRNTEINTSQDVFQYMDKSSFRCNVSTLVLPSTLRTISKYFFTQTTANAIKINGAIGNIPSYSFRNSKIKNVFIEEGVSEVGEGAFLGSDIEKISLPSSLRIIQDSAFKFCDKLNKISFSEGLETIKREAFAACLNLKEVIFPNSLKYIGAYAFGPYGYGEMKLEKVSFGENLEVIEESAFQYNKNLRVVDLKNIKRIESGAFYYCRKLSKVKIGKNIEYINIRAFKDCAGVAIYCYAKEPPCDNLYNVTNFYVLEENYKTWVNSGSVASDKVRIFDPNNVDFGVDDSGCSCSFNYFSWLGIIFGVGIFLSLVYEIIKKYKQ